VQTEHERLEQFLATAGSSNASRTPVEGRLASAIYERELGRRPDATFVAPRLDTDGDVEAFVSALRASQEWWTTHHPTLGAHTVAFRTLSGRLSARGTLVAPQVIAECIAAYRLLFTRDPDLVGLDHFVALRDGEGLVAALRVLLGSGEAQQHLGPDEQPPIGALLIAVSSAAMSLLSAVASDNTLGVAIATRASVDHLVHKLDLIGRAIDELATLCEMRFDGGAHA